MNAYVKLELCWYVLSVLDKHDDSFSPHYHQEQSDLRCGSVNKSRGRGRTFYGRRAQQPASEGQKTLTEGFTNQNNEMNRDGSQQTNGRAPTCSENLSSQNSWQEHNGYSKNCSTGGSKACAYDSSRHQTLPEYMNDLWPEVSAETVPCSTSVNGNGSLPSRVVPLSPDVHEGWCACLKRELFIKFHKIKQ